MRAKAHLQDFEAKGGAQVLLPSWFDFEELVPDKEEETSSQESLLPFVEPVASPHPHPPSPSRRSDSFEGPAMSSNSSDANVDGVMLGASDVEVDPAVDDADTGSGSKETNNK